MARPFAGLVFRVFAWLPATFAVWYVAAPVLMWPVAIGVRALAHAFLADLVRGVAQVGAILVFTTTLSPGLASERSAQVTVEVNMLLYAFGLPLYAALVLAAREPGTSRRLGIGYVALLPVVAWGVLANFLKDVAIAAGPALASQTGFVGWQREAIALAYQFGSLILPTTVPAIAWVLTHRAFLERLRSGAG